MLHEAFRDQTSDDVDIVWIPHNLCASGKHGRWSKRPLMVRPGSTLSTLKLTSEKDYPNRYTYIYIDILYPNNICVYHWISGSGLQPEHDKSTYNSAYNSEGFLQSWGDPPGPVLPFRHLLSRTTLGAGNIRPALKTEKVNLPKLDSSKSLGTKNKRKFGWLQLVSMILHFMGPTKFHVFNQY